jgi:secondary thiamine-phosphate synthase enzyme
MASELSAQGHRVPRERSAPLVAALAPACVVDPAIAGTLSPQAERRGRSGRSGREDGPVDTTVIDLDTTGRTIVDLTDALRAFCAGRGDGLVNLFAPHATAGLALMEVGSGSEGDLEVALDRLLPRDDRYRHRHGSPGHGADHLLPVLVSPSLTLPVADGSPLLGTWQSPVLIDTNADNPRREVRMTFVRA